MARQINGLSNKEPKEKVRQELRRPVPDKEKKIDFFPATAGGKKRRR